MTKSLVNKIRLKEHLYTSMDEGTPIQNHLDEFNSIIIDLESLDVKLENEDKAILLVVSLPTSDKHFKEIMLYSNNDTLSFDDVKANLLSEEKFDLEVRSDDKAKGFSVRGRASENEDTIREIPCQSPGDVNPTSSDKCCLKPGHLVAECYKLKTKKAKEEKNNQPAEASVVDSGSDGDVLLVTTMDNQGATEGVLNSNCTYHIYPHID